MAHDREYRLNTSLTLFVVCWVEPPNLSWYNLSARASVQSGQRTWHWGDPGNWRRVTDIEESFEIKLPTIWTDEEQRSEVRDESQKGKSKREEKNKEKERREEKKREGKRRAGQGRAEKRRRDQWKVSQRKSEARRSRCKKREERLEKPVFFQGVVPPEGRTVGSLKRRVPSYVARWQMENCTALWYEAHFRVKWYKAHHTQTTFGSGDVKKVHVVLVRSAFSSEKCQKLTVSSLDHLWKLRCQKKCRLLRREANTLIGTRHYQAVRSALNFPLLKEVSQIPFFLTMLSSSKIADVWQTWLGLDVVNFKHKGRLAELLRFQACRLRESQADRWTDKRTEKWTGKWAKRWIVR